MIVRTTRYVTKAVASMLADWQIVEVTQSVKLVFIQRLVNVCLDSRAIRKLHVHSVSKRQDKYDNFLYLQKMGLEYCMFHFKLFITHTVGLPIEPTLSVGCLINDECPLYAACRNRQCINPCAEDNPCAPSAICKVINHEPECTCPDGFIGSPLTDCRPRKCWSIIQKKKRSCH